MLRFELLYDLLHTQITISRISTKPTYNKQSSKAKGHQLGILQWCKLENETSYILV